MNVARSAVRPIAMRWPARLSLPRPAWPDPVRGLRWLRAGVLAMIATCAALCLLVTYQGHRELATATGPGARAIIDVNRARHALFLAGQDVRGNFAIGDASLASAGSPFTVELAAANHDLSQAAEANIAGPLGTARIQFAQSLLANYSDEIAQADADAVSSSKLGLADVLATEGSSGILRQAELSLTNSAVGTPRLAERNAVREAMRSRWLGTGDVWPVLLAPFLAILLLAGGTTGLLWRGFRRVLSVRLVIALGLTLGLVVLIAQLTVYDASRANSVLSGALDQTWRASVTPPTSTAYSPWSLALGLLLVIGAAVLAYSSYQPRIEEYRYRP
jgi:hypothetical protein